LWIGRKGGREERRKAAHTAQQLHVASPSGPAAASLLSLGAGEEATSEKLEALDNVYTLYNDMLCISISESHFTTHRNTIVNS
jgi:hypothetical protein